MHFFVSVPTLGRAEAAPVETWVSCREWFSLGMVLPGLQWNWESVSSCFMFFVALSFEQRPKRWDTDCRCVSGTPFCLGAAVPGLCGLQ